MIHIYISIYILYVSINVRNSILYITINSINYLNMLMYNIIYYTTYNLIS